MHLFSDQTPDPRLLKGKILISALIVILSLILLMKNLAASVHLVIVFSLWLLWICRGPGYLPIKLLLLLTFSLLPFMISATFLEKSGISSQWIEQVLNISPFYHLFSIQGNAWISEVLYADSLMHYSLDTGNMGLCIIFGLCIGLMGFWTCRFE